MRWLLLGLLAACGDSAIDMKLLVPTEVAAFDMSCVSAVEVLALGSGDSGSPDIGQRMDKVPCVDLATAPKNFAGLQTLLAGKFDVPLPKGGLTSVEMRGRSGNCAEAPAEYAAVFYGGANYRAGDTELRVKLSRSISCDAHSTFTVHPVDMLSLFENKVCPPEWSETTATVQANDIRATNLTSPAIIVENGLDTKPMTTSTVSVDSFNAAYPGTCAAMELDASDGTGLSCINAGGATACSSTNLEIAVLKDTFLGSADPALVKQYGAASFVGVWTTTGTAGPVNGATIALDAGETGKIVYGSIDTAGGKFLPSGAATTPEDGMAIVYAGSIVGITVSAPGKTDRHLYVGASAAQASAQIAVVN